MEQLLNISTIPINVEITVNRARLDYNNHLPKVKVTRDRGGLQIEAEPIKLHLDGQRMRDSLNMKKSADVTKDFADKGMKVSYQAIATIVQDGNKLVSPQGISPAEIASQKVQRSIETILEFLPKEGPEMSWTGGTLKVNYQADKMNFDWDLKQQAAFNFIPGSIEFRVTQYPDVKIEYVGGPIYVPPSADPNYVEPELDVKV